MIRILQVVTYMGRGGLETMLMNYYRKINREEIQFDFLTHRNFEADYDAEIRELGGKIYHLPTLNPFSKEYKKALNEFFVQHPEYKIVHVHQDCMSSVILKCAKNNNVPVRIAHSHNSNQDKNLKYLIKLYYKSKIPKDSTALFACSREAGDWMFDGAEYKLLNNAIDTKQYIFSSCVHDSIRSQLNIPKDALVIGNIARFAPQKNHDFLIDVFSEIYKRNTKAMLLLVGDGDLRPVITEKVKELGLTEKVIFAGVRNDIPEIIQGMNIFLMPSLYEGLPVSLIEAQAGGLPCIVSDNFSPQCNITPLVHNYPLNNSASQWADLVLSMADEPKTDTTDMIQKAGFDITDNAKWLEKYYKDLWEKN